MGKGKEKIIASSYINKNLTIELVSVSVIILIYLFIV